MGFCMKLNNAIYFSNNLTNCSKLCADEGYHSHFIYWFTLYSGLWFLNLFQGFKLLFISYLRSLLMNGS